MARPKPVRNKGKRSGKWSIAPPPNWALEDLTVLREVDGELGVALLLALYNIRLLASAPKEVRSQLFSGQSAIDQPVAVPEDVRDALTLFSEIVRIPGEIEDRDLARGCRAVAEWAEAHSKAITAVAYAEAAAHLIPDNPELAILAGRACRRAADRPRAELWYERGWGLARRADDIQQYVDAHLGFGNLLRDFGEYGRALRAIRRAGLSARKKGMKESGAEAIHDAYILAYVQEDLARASSLARRASRVYPVHAKRRPYFTADLALLLSRRGLYIEALELLKIVQEHLRAPVERLHVSGLIAYAAGGARDLDAFETARVQVRESADQYPEVGGAALAYVAAGAQLLQEWEDADLLIAEAKSRTEGDVLASNLAARVGRDIAARSPGVPRPAEDDSSVAPLRGIVPDVAARLRRWRGPTWRPPKR